LIAERFPQVGLLDPTQPNTWKAIELMLSFPNTRQTEESAARTALYRAAAGRNQAMAAEVDYPVMMRTLGLRATWSPARSKHLKRAQELLQRTNQFNTTTKRRTLAELRDLLSDRQHRVFVCSLADRFGDLGIVGVVILELSGDSIVFDTVVMSCRAMGFGLESLLVRAPLDHMLRETGVRMPVRGLFYPTDRNEPAASVFKEAGFSLDAERQWELPAHQPLPEVAEWLTVDLKSADL
jgi:FkbH-like protein